MFSITNRFKNEVLRGKSQHTNGCNEINSEEDWTRFVSGIYPVAHHPTIAVLWIAGYGATKMESLSEHQLRIDIDNLLRKFNPSMKAWTNATQILTITVKMHCLFQW